MGRDGGELQMLINIILVLISQSRINENDVITVLGKILFKTILKIQDKDTLQKYLEDIR